jgi:hypothetical protein
MHSVDTFLLAFIAILYISNPLPLFILQHLYLGGYSISLRS